MRRRLVRAVEWAVLLPLWREATHIGWLRAVAATGVGLIWLIAILVGIAATLGGSGNNGNQPFDAVGTKRPAASATAKPTAATPRPTATVTPEPRPSLALPTLPVTQHRAAPAKPGPPATAPPLPGAAVLVGAGDIASCSSTGDEATAALLDSIPGLVFTAGDNAYESGSRAEYANCYDPSWGRHKARTKPVPGNHEYLTVGARGYFDYFGVPNYYAYDLGGWRVYALNSGSIDKAVELAWLSADLAANPRHCVMAYWHHPVFTNGPHADDEAGMRAIWNTLAANHADLIINGHDHHYERFAPISGMREIVVGTGGKGITTPSRSEPGLEVENHDTFGVLKLTLRDGGYDWQFIPVAGKTFTDNGSDTCR